MMGGVQRAHPLSGRTASTTLDERIYNTIEYRCVKESLWARKGWKKNNKNLGFYSVSNRKNIYGPKFSAR